MIKILNGDNLEEMVEMLLGGQESEKEFDLNHYIRYNVGVSFTEIGCCNDSPVGFSFEEISRLKFQTEEFNYFWRKMQEVE